MPKKAPKPSGWYKDKKEYQSGYVSWGLYYGGIKDPVIEASRESTIDILLAKRTGE